MSDQIVRVLAQDGSLRACAAETTRLVEEIRRRQQTDPTATVAIGRLATGAALMGSLLKGDQQVGLVIEGNGPLGKIQAEADAKGHVRATLKNPLAGLPPRNNRFDVVGAIGKAGFLHVIKDLGLKEPYRGMVQLYSSEVADDLAYYFTASEQTPSSVALGVELDQQAHVAAAGGFLLQLMPEADPQLIEALENKLFTLPPATSLLRQGHSPLQLIDRLLDAIPYQVLTQSTLSFACSCSREQITRALATLGSTEIQDMLEKTGNAEITCEYCKEVYRFQRSDLEQIKALAN